MYSYKLKYYLLFFLASSLVITLLLLERNIKIQGHLDEGLHKVLHEYQSIYTSKQNLATLVFESKINQKEIIDIFKKAHLTDRKEELIQIRQELYKELKPTYNYLESIEIRQLHFHLPNNHSFLRFHRPNKYGDDLTNFRKTIAYVNKNKVPIHGFEEGRIYNGYRFVFPLFDEVKNHIGSVEVSFSTLAMQKAFRDSFHEFTKVVLKDEVVDSTVFDEERTNYIKSTISGYMVEKRVYDFIKNSPELRTNPSNIQEVLTKLKDEKAFGSFDEYHESFYIPLNNSIDKSMVGVFIVKHPHHYINNKKKNFIFLSIVSLLFISLLTYHFYKTKTTRISIEKNNSKLSTILNEANSGIALINNKGRFLEVNEAFLKLIGYEKEDLFNMKFQDITLSATKKEVLKHFKNARKEVEVSKEKIPFEKKSKETVYLDLSINKIQNENNFIIVLNSIEQKLILEDLVKQKVAELRKKDEILIEQSKNAAMGEMIDIIAHQWINPVNVINLYAQTIELDCKEDYENSKDSIKESSKRIQKQVNHLAETLKEFRQFFRPSQEFYNIRVGTLIDSVLLLMKDELKRNRISTNKIGSFKPTILISPNEFKHVIINIINNAKDAFIEKNIYHRELTFEVINYDKYLELKIRDNAGGIPKEILDKIFEPNFTTKESIGGTGIGLHMTKQILDKIDGKVKVENISNGVCFTLTFTKI